LHALSRSAEGGLAAVPGAADLKPPIYKGNPGGLEAARFASIIAGSVEVRGLATAHMRIEAPDDDAARALAKKLVDELDIELWQRPHLIVRLVTERRRS
jgi:hypothetical protein